LGSEGNPGRKATVPRVPGAKAGRLWTKKVGEDTAQKGKVVNCVDPNLPETRADSDKRKKWQRANSQRSRQRKKRAVWYLDRAAQGRLQQKDLAGQKSRYEGRPASARILTNKRRTKTN